MNGAFRLAILLFLAAPVAFGFDTEPPFEDPALQARYENLTEEIRCAVCQNQAISDSPSELAVDLRGQVRRMLEAGNSDAEILDFMVARYGDYVRYRPPFSPRTWLLWLSPLLLFVGGGWLLVGVLRKRVETDPPADDGDGIGV